MTDKNSHFWKLVKADRVRYFGPNPPGPLGPDNFVELLRPDPPPELTNELLAGAGDLLQTPAAPPTLATGAGGIFRPGTTGPLPRLTDLNLRPEVGSSPPLVPPIALPPLAVEPLPIPTIDESPTGPAPDLSALDLPPGCFLPSSALPTDLPIAAGAMDYPGPVDLPLPGVSSAVGALANLLTSPSDAGCFSPGGGGPADFGADSVSGGNTASAGSTSSGTFSDCVSSPLPRLTVVVGEAHRMASSVVAAMSRNSEQLARGVAQYEVRRAFDLYQANRRAMFSVFDGRR